MSKAIAIPECKKDIGCIKEDISLSPTEKRDGAIGILSRFLRFDALSKRNNAPESPTPTEPPTTFYGVYIPCEIKKGPDEGMYTNNYSFYCIYVMFSFVYILSFYLILSSCSFIYSSLM